LTFVDQFLQLSQKGKARKAKNVTAEVVRETRSKQKH